MSKKHYLVVTELCHGEEHAYVEIVDGEKDLVTSNLAERNIVKMFIAPSRRKAEQSAANINSALEWWDDKTAEQEGKENLS